MLGFGLLIIILVILLLLLGRAKLPRLAKSIGGSAGELQKGFDIADSQKTDKSKKSVSKQDSIG